MWCLFCATPEVESSAPGGIPWPRMTRSFVTRTSFWQMFLNSVETSMQARYVSRSGTCAMIISHTSVAKKAFPLFIPCRAADSRKRIKERNVFSTTSSFGMPWIISSSSPRNLASISSRLPGLLACSSDISLEWTCSISFKALSMEPDS